MNTRKFDFQLAIKRWVVFTVEKFPPPEPTAFDPRFSARTRVNWVSLSRKPFRSIPTVRPKSGITTRITRLDHFNSRQNHEYRPNHKTHRHHSADHPCSSGLRLALLYRTEIWIDEEQE
jgi:hypothetical protein